MEFQSFIGGCLGGFAGILSSYPFDTIKVRIQQQTSRNLKYTGAIDCLRKTIAKESVGALYRGATSPLIGSMFINAILFGVEENVRKLLKANNSNKKHMNKTTQSSQLEHYKFYAVSGAIAGFAQSILLSPIELIKIKMQIPECRYRTTYDCARDLIRNHGLRSVMRGFNLTAMREVPAVTSYFISFEYICNSVKRSRDQCSVVDLLYAGGAAGCLSWLITYPIDVVKTRYQIDNSYKSMLDCVRKTYRAEGFAAFWRGLSPTLLRAFPNNASVFATVTLFNRFYANRQNEELDFINYIPTMKEYKDLTILSSYLFLNDLYF